MKLTSNQINVAIANAPSVQLQNQAMDEINSDVVDMVNTIAGWVMGGVPPMSSERPKTVEDVRLLFSRASARLRLIKAATNQETE